MAFPTRCCRLRFSIFFRLQAVKQVIDVDRKDVSEFIEDPGRNPVGTGLVFLKLLMADPQCVGKRSKRPSGFNAKSPDIRTHQKVGCFGFPV